MKRHLALALLMCLGAGNALYAKPEKIAEFDAQSIYILRGTTDGKDGKAIVIDELKSNLPLGIHFATSMLLSYLPLEYLLGTGYKVTTWYITGATAGVDAVNFGIKTMSKDIIEAGLAFEKGHIDPELVTEIFTAAAASHMASARSHYGLSAAFAGIAYKFADYAAPMLEELMPKLVGAWFWKYGVVENANPGVVRTENNNDLSIKTQRGEKILIADGNYKYIPAALITLNALRAYQLSEQLRAEIVEIAELLIQSDKIGLATRPDLIARMRSACNDVLADSVVTRWGAKKSLNRVISRVVAQQERIKVA